MVSSFGCVPGAVARSWLDAAGRVGSVWRSEVPVTGHRFPGSCRLTSRMQFKAVYAEGHRASCRCFTLFARPNSSDHCRLGLTVTRKVGCAVVRNRVKRILRDVFRQNRERLDLPLDLVVNARASVLERPVPQLERDFLECFQEVSRRFRP